MPNDEGMSNQQLNSKSEYRNSNQIEKAEIQMFKKVFISDALNVRVSNFGLVSDFGFRISSFLLLVLLLLIGSTAVAENIGILGSKPKWDVLEHYQGTITHDEFAHLINDVYCTHGVPDDLIRVDKDSAQIVTDKDSHAVFVLKFAPDENS